MKTKTLLAALLFSASIAGAQNFKTTSQVANTDTYLTEGKIMTHWATPINTSYNSYGVGYTNYTLVKANSPLGDAIVTSSVTCTDLTGSQIFKNRYFFGTLSTSPPTYSNNQINSICEFKQGEESTKYAVTGTVSNENIKNTKGDVLFAIMDKATGIPSLVKAINIAGFIGLGYDNEDVGRKIIHEEATGSFYITGSTKSIANGNDLFFVLKLDDAGTVIWCHSYDVYTSVANERNSYGNDLLILDSKIYVIGDTKGLTLASYHIGHNHGFLAEIDEASGSLLNINTYDYFAENSFFKSFVYDNLSDAFAVCGSMDVFIGVVYPLLIQIDRSTFNVNWNNNYELVPPLAGFEHSEFSDIFFDVPSQQYHLVGTFNDVTSITGNTHDIVSGTVDRFGSIGSFIRHAGGYHQYEMEDRGVSIDMINVAEGANEDAKVLYCYSNSDNLTMENLFLKPMLLDNDYCIMQGIEPSVTTYPFNVQGHNWITNTNFRDRSLEYVLEEIDYRILCSGNAFKEGESNSGNSVNKDDILLGQIRVELNGDNYYNNIQIDKGAAKSDKYKVVLFDISGREIYSNTVNGSTVSFNLNGINRGVYLLVMYDENNVAVSYSKVIY